ncbi:MAG: transposon-transfer assisting family protein [Lachnospiraceae bacterium]|nr:transposon-transfer assisting family protein [Lachnospiraceae bacterium]
MSNFTVEEINLMCVFDRRGRTELIEDIGQVLPHLDDKDMEELANRVIGKLRNMTDEGFAEVVLESAE